MEMQQIDYCPATGCSAITTEDNRNPNDDDAFGWYTCPVCGQQWRGDVLDSRPPADAPDGATCTVYAGPYLYFYERRGGAWELVGDTASWQLSG